VEVSYKIRLLSGEKNCEIAQIVTFGGKRKTKWKNTSTVYEPRETFFDIRRARQTEVGETKNRTRTVEVK
jgi:hypothetical protein